MEAWFNYLTPNSPTPRIYQPTREHPETRREGDYAPFHRLVDVLARPFDEQPAHAELEDAPEPHEIVQQTFCGT